MRETKAAQLYRCLRFYRLYPQMVGTPSPLLTEQASTDLLQLLTRLSYSHLGELVNLQDPLQRSFYEVEVLSGKLVRV